ncbi:MAG: class I SAM-dependent methyltransferase [Nakamurella sp.]
MTPPGASQRVATLFDSVAPTYEAVGAPWFEPICRRLVAEMDPRDGDVVLDAGCGRGVAFPALAAAVGTGGRVVGIDISPGMVERARDVIDRHQLHHVEVRLMDAVAPALPPVSFSMVVSSLVLFFLPDPAAALRSWHDLLVPSGRLGVITFAERDPRWVEVDGLLTPYLPPQMRDARTTGVQGPFASDAGMADLVTAAGFDKVRTVRWDQPLVLRDVEHWRTWSMSLGQRAMWQAVPAAAQEEILRRAAEILAPSGGPIVLHQTIRLTRAERPSVGRPH